MRFAFIRRNEGVFRLTRMCRVLSVTRQGYYAWRRRSPSTRAVTDTRLLVEIRAIFKRSRRSYGSPRIHRPEPTEKTVDLARSVPLAPGDLEQVLLNLMVNASHADELDPRVAVSVRARPDGPAGPAWGPHVASTVESDGWATYWGTEGPVIEISVTDQGSGIGEDVLELLFREQVTTKPREHGTGLGALLCRELVRASSGALWIESHVGKGTTATVVLRIADEAQDEQPDQAPGTDA